MATRPDIQVVDVQIGDWDTAEAMRITEDWLQQYPDLAAIASMNDSMILGSIEAAKAAGRELLFFGVDGMADGCNAVKEGTLTATVLQDAREIAKGGLELAARCLNGEKLTGADVLHVDAALIAPENVDEFIAGHSRLGKTALWTAANDERFRVAFISASGNSGASLHRFKGDDNEHLAQIKEVFPYWFSKRYPQYAGHEDEMPFDMHMLLGSLAPRSFYVCSGSTDTWAGPNTEYLCCEAASEPYRMLGGQGLVHPDRFPQAGDAFDSGDVGYSMHEGGHFMGSFEWNNVMEFMKRLPTLENQ